MKNFSVNHRMGDGETDPPLETLDSLYAELFEFEDSEHPDVSVYGAKLDMSLAAHASGLLVREDFVTDRSYHLVDVSKEKVLELWRALATGDSQRVASEAWRDGYP